ncbi:MAG: signal peptidase II [Candidatus Parcubacteria bacterium]|nr:signal peptidase II [Candidatus Parcubacteria bacterium]
MASKICKIGLIILSSFGLFVLESIIKYTIVNKIPSQGFYLFKPILQIIYTPNYNIAFSLPLPVILIYFLVISALIFLCFLWWHNVCLGNTQLILANSLIIIGATSNLIDRFMLGYVVDYINIVIWPIFNLADCLIVAGITIYFLSEFKRK